MRLPLALALALLALPGPAHAATVAREGDDIVYRSDPGESDHVYFQGGADDEEFSSQGAPIRPGPGCKATHNGGHLARHRHGSSARVR